MYYASALVAALTSALPRFAELTVQNNNQPGWPVIHSKIYLLNTRSIRRLSIPPHPPANTHFLPHTHRVRHFPQRIPLPPHLPDHFSYFYVLPLNNVQHEFFCPNCSGEKTDLGSLEGTSLPFQIVISIILPFSFL